MDKKESMELLLSLKGKMTKVSELTLEKNRLEEELQRAKAVSPKAVGSFDSERMHPYIISKIGSRPIENKTAHFFEFSKKAKEKKDYEQALNEYDYKYNKCVEDYYKEFAAERNRLEVEERANIDINIREKESNYNSLLQKYEEAKSVLLQDSLLSDNLKSEETVDQLITFFSEYRAETMKEAINLYYEEQHRRKLEDFVAEQVRLTAEARDAALSASQYADDAAYKAEQAVEKAEQALDQAERAYSLADNAYSLAESAYDKALDIQG